VSQFHSEENIFNCKFVELHIQQWASADFFFQGRAKIFQGGGQEPTFCLKTTKKILYFPKKSKNLIFLAGQGGREPPLPPSTDAHAFNGKHMEAILFENIILKKACALTAYCLNLDQNGGSTTEAMQ
jgi:hypothetical protein